MRMLAVVLSSCFILSGCQDPNLVSRRQAAEALPPPRIVTEVPPESAVLTPLPRAEGVRLLNRQLLVDGVPFIIRAVCWNPVRKGSLHPDGLLFRNPSVVDLQLIEQDLQLMSRLGVNTIRTYEPILNERVLALVQRYKLHLIVPVFNYYATAWTDVEALVNKLKDQPTTLFWEIGNEWNYNQFYSSDKSPIGLGAAKALVKKAVSVIRSLDQRLPISTVYGDLPPRELLTELSGIDIWGFNIYSGLSFGDRLQRWRSMSDKPMYLGEYGADAINRTELDENSQAKAVVALSIELQQNASAIHAENAVLGGAIFEWNDEWWKDARGSPNEHDIGGIAPGGGPFPDMVFNEEWWGLVDIDRQVRLAYREMQKLWNPAAKETL